MKAPNYKYQIPNGILASYNIGKVWSTKVVTGGLVHDTYHIQTSKGEFIVQKLHPVLASKAIGLDFLAVTKYLKAEGFLAPELVLTKRGEVLVKKKGETWRMQTKLPGKTIHVLKNRAMARECGEIYAKFHRVMNGFPHRFKSTKILHETEKVFQWFQKTVLPLPKSGSPPFPRGANGGLPTGVAEEVEFIRRELPKYFLPSTLPMRVIHGDPKISNILFDQKGRAKAIIDLDTCNHRPLLVELGDAFRSWCGGAEDDPNNTFSLPIFRAAWSGYRKGAGDMMTRRELQYVPKAIGTIILELASRFLTDYFTDNYFGWDSSRYSSRRAHNLARARGQIAEFLDYQKKLPEIRKIVQM